MRAEERAGAEGDKGDSDGKKKEYPCAPILARFPNENPSDVLEKVQLFASRDHLQRKDCYVVAKTSKGKPNLAVTQSLAAH